MTLAPATPAKEDPPVLDPEKVIGSKPVRWGELPRKDQLIVLTLIRLGEPLTQTSLVPYMFYMLQSFDQSLPDAAIAYQAGYLAASYTAAQCLTAVIWGRLADKEWMGRKNILLLGTLGTLLSSVGFGFSTSFRTAIIYRILGGAVNGNIGVMRTVSCFRGVKRLLGRRELPILPFSRYFCHTIT